MSRIHEALKKAEQDRSASRVDRKLEEPSALIDLRQPIQVSTNGNVVLTPSVSPVLKTLADPQILQLEELRAKCVKTTWNLDSNFLVFSKAKDILFHQAPNNFAPCVPDFTGFARRSL